MPESKGRPDKNTRSRDKAREQTPVAKQVANPSWWVPVMCGLMILGVVWVSTFYITSGDWPAPIGYWNLVVGLGAIMAGFAMATRWR